MSAKRSPHGSKKPKSEGYSIGDKVMAKFPGSPLYYKATVMTLGTNNFDVEFEDGQEHSIPIKYVYHTGSQTFARTPQRRGRSKSPARRNSPGRAGSQKSSRRTKSSTRSKERVTKKKVDSPPAKTSVTAKGGGDVTDSQGKEKTVGNAVTPRTPPRKRNNPIRMSARLIAKAEETAVIKKLVLPESTPDDKRKYLLAKEVPDGIQKEKSSDMEFGGWLGTTFLALLYPATLLGLHITCTKKSCTVMKPPVIPQKLEVYFDLNASGIFLGFVLVQVILSLLPVGKRIEGRGKLQYRCNGFVSLFLTLAAVPGFIYYKLPLNIIYSHYLQLLVTSLIFSLLLAVVLYVKGRRAAAESLNPGGNTGSILYDFYMGKQLNPRFGRIDVKQMLVRISMIGLVMVNISLVFHDVKSTGVYSPCVLVAAAFQLFYALDTLWFEENLITMFDVTSEGVGSMLTVGYLSYPFLPTLITKFLVDYRVKSNWYILSAVIMLNLIGYVIFRSSSSQKSEFKKNPFNPSLAQLETIPTIKGHRLLVSGWWGWVRHPNYLGDILIHWSWALPCAFTHVIPYYLPMMTTVFLMHRAARDDRKCMKKYRAAWDRYCNKVKYRIIPRIY